MFFGLFALHELPGPARAARAPARSTSRRPRAAAPAGGPGRGGGRRGAAGAARPAGGAPDGDGMPDLTPRLSTARGRDPGVERPALRRRRPGGGDHAPGRRRAATPSCGRASPWSPARSRWPTTCSRPPTGPSRAGRPTWCPPRCWPTGAARCPWPPRLVALGRGRASRPPAGCRPTCTTPSASRPRPRSASRCSRPGPQSPAQTAFEVACSWARAGQPDEALRWVEAAVDAGFRAPGLLDGEPDLAPVRALPGLARGPVPPVGLTSGRASAAMRPGTARRPGVGRPQQGVRHS